MAKIVSLGHYFFSDLIDEWVTIGSNDSILGADVLFVDVQSVLNDFMFHYRHYDQGSLTSEGKRELNDSLIRRQIEIADILKNGGSVFAFIPPAIEKKGMDTSEMLSEIIFADDSDSYFSLLNGLGNNFEIIPEEPYKSFFESNKKIFFPKSFFESKFIPKYYDENSKQEIMPKTILTIKNSSMPIAFHYNINNKGNLFLIPEIKTNEDLKKGYKKAENEFILSCLELAKNLKFNDSEKIDLPEWLNKYLIFDEKDHLEKLRTNEAKILKIQKQIELQKNKLQSIQKYKLLLSSHGEILENLVEKIFKDLGFEIIKNKKSNRVDFTLKYKTKNLVVEVKGKTKSAAEKDARQLHVWVAEHSLESEKDPKGLLIVNTFRDVTIDKRTETSFPFSSGTVVQKNEFCLMTTLQLLCLYIDCKNNPTKTDKIVNKIFKCTGELPEYQNWQDYININE